MPLTTEKLTRESFRSRYAHQKPYFELLDGEAVQKSVPTRLHSILQFILAVILKELGFKSRPELTLAIDESWEPTPDVCGVLGPEEDPYPTRAVAVAIEVLSPDDRFTRVSGNAASMQSGASRIHWFTIRSAGTLGIGMRSRAISFAPKRHTTFGAAQSNQPNRGLSPFRRRAKPALSLHAGDRRSTAGN
jgi:hypothetical protein